MNNSAEHVRKTSIILIVAAFIVGMLLIYGGFVARSQAADHAVTCPADGKFHIVQSIICDPDGKPFLPRGINEFAGQTFSNFGESSDIATSQIVSNYVDGWNFNMLRIVMCPTGPCQSHPFTRQATDLDALINAYTARKVVIMLDYHQLPLASAPSQADIDTAAAWFKQMAIKYKDNPYVWLESFNEPIDGNDGIQTWSNFSNQIIDATRSVNPDKVVVICSGNYGQDTTGNGSTYDAAGSHILTAGPAMAAKGNVMFDIHFYSRWQAVNVAGIKAYFDAVHNAGLAVVVGETWGDSNGPDYMKGDQLATDQLYAARPNGVGILPWSSGGNYPAANGQSSRDVNTNSNLTHNGMLQWNWSHSPPSAVADGYTVTTGGVTVTPGGSTPSPTAGVSPTVTANNCPATKPYGDADCDGFYKLADYAIWLLEYRGTDTALDADFNNSRSITLSDYEIWRRTFTGAGTITSTPSTPTPTSVSCASPSQEESTADNCNGNMGGTHFKETFTGSPTAPTSLVNNFPRWYMQPALQGQFGWDFAPQPMEAAHGMNCGAPPMSHHMTTFEDTIFSCKDHVMTAISPPDGGTSAGLVGLKPNHLVDLSQGEATIRIDVSTFSPSAGDWWEIWFTPWDDQLVSPSDHWLHHAGPPKNAIQLEVADFPPSNTKNWSHQVYHDYQMQIPEFSNNGATIAFWKGPDIRPKVPVSDTRRDLYEVRMTKDHMKLYLKTPQTNMELVLVDEFDIPGGFGADAAVVQFQQSNYEPRKGRKIGCADDAHCPDFTTPATWHWDNAEIFPAIPYTIVDVTPMQVVNGRTDTLLTFKKPAPAGARMLFNGQSVGNSFTLTFNDGSTAQATAVRPRNGEAGGTGPGLDPDFLTYTVNVPLGVTSAHISGVDYCSPANCGSIIGEYGVWEAQNFHIIAR